MYRAFLLGILLLAAYSHGATVAERIAELDQAKGVSDVSEVPNSREAHPVYPGWQIARLAYLYTDEATGVIQDNAIEVWIDGGGQCHYARRRPAVLEVEQKFLSSRTAGGWANLSRAAQATAIEGFCNSVYQAANAGAQAIREFQVTAISGSIIKVTGYFDKGTSWAMESWYVRLIDPNGSVAAPYSNIEFEKATG